MSRLSSNAEGPTVLSLAELSKSINNEDTSATPALSSPRRHDVTGFTALCARRRSAPRRAAPRRAASRPIPPLLGFVLLPPCVLLFLPVGRAKRQKIHRDFLRAEDRKQVSTRRDTVFAPRTITRSKLRPRGTPFNSLK